MSFCILLYSSDPVRGRILEKSFNIAGLEATRCATARDLRDGLTGKIHDAVVIDTKGGFWDEARQVIACCRILKKSAVIILADRQALPALQARGLRYDLMIPEPFDPERAVARMQQLAADKKKRLRTACSSALLRPVPARSGSASEAFPC
jgi:DNA-binding response OmpR family regulator